jgi:hypothetical protein
MTRLQLFSWGFSGWGNATRQLVAAIDAAERQRGFAPPIFVDIRFKRSGRAAGFRDDAFENVTGWRRYRWMRTLGNKNIGTRRRAEIESPSAVHQLIDLARDAADRGSRVIFFCACESPTGTCHRHIVSALVRRVARHRGLQVQIQEWPGGNPSRSPVVVRVRPKVLANVRRGAKRVPLEQKRVPVRWTGIPWGTIVVLRAGQEELAVAVGPAKCRAETWFLPIFCEHEGGRPSDVGTLPGKVARMRRRYKLG